MDYLKPYQQICALFPPIISQSVRNKIFPLEKARKLKLDFSKASITGSTFHGNTSDDHSYRFAIHGFFDWRNIIITHSYLKQFKGDIIEVGANVGTETISYCDLVFPKGRVYAFEPLPDNILSLNKLALNIKNLIIYPKAISNEKAIMHFQLPPKHESGVGKIVNIENNNDLKNTIEIDTLPLDSFFDIFENVGLIAIDTEGHEPFVLEGSRKIISKFRPAVIIEVSPKLLKKYAGSSSANIFKFFKDKDYVCLKIDSFTLTEVEEDDFNSSRTQNWLCIPSEKNYVIRSIKRDLFLRAIVPWYFLKSIKSSSPL